MKKIIYLALTAILSFTLIQSCSKSDGGAGNNNSSSFDRKAMLTNISGNIIIPAYTSYQAAAIGLDAAVTTFNATPNITNLTALQNAFTVTYQQWQSTSVYDFGPAADVSLRVNTNTYPTDVNQIAANINAGTYNPLLLSNLTAKGLPALDYLLFNLTGDNAAVLALFTTDVKAANRRNYLAALSAELKTNATTVLNAWIGPYKATFLNATGTDASSSTGYLVNQLVYDYEVLKNFEIGIPAGSQSMGAILPAKVQAYYSKRSLQLTLLHLQAIQNLYLGASGLGLDDYLIAVNAKTSTGGSLNDAIKTQFAAANAKLQTLTDPLATNITNNPTAVMAAYTELQKLTVILKNDMTSALGISITFGDNDGD
jgi:predicted lipoprotein